MAIRQPFDIADAHPNLARTTASRTALVRNRSFRYVFNNVVNVHCHYLTEGGESLFLPLGSLYRIRRGSPQT